MAGRVKYSGARAVSYKKPKKRKPKPTFTYDKELAEQMLKDSVERDKQGLHRVSPNGRCHVCDKPVSPMRKICAHCALIKEEERKNR